MQEIIEKYSIGVIKNVNKDNMCKIIDFLQKEQCDFIEDIITDYLDLFVIDYDNFIIKYQILNKKYSNSYLKCVKEDMNFLEEFFFD